MEDKEEKAHLDTLKKAHPHLCTIQGCGRYFACWDMDASYSPPSECRGFLHRKSGQGMCWECRG